MKTLCDRHDMDYDECRNWYDGYHQRKMDLYNPESVVKSMLKKEYGSYWGKTSTYEAVARALDISHIHVTSNRSYNNEDALQSAIYLSYIYALNSYTCVREVTAGKGFADVIYIPVHPSGERPAMVIELKNNKTAQSAIEQIRDRKYFECMSNYAGVLLFVGINYDEKEKTHTCMIERFEVG